MGKKEQPVVLSLGDHEVRITSPSKIYFPEVGITKLDLVRYYLHVAEGAIRGIRGRPVVLKRYVKGIKADFFFQKRAPESRPEWIEVVTLRYPSGRSAEEVVITEPAQLAWIINLGCIDLNPHPVRADDLDHPDELRVDLDPGPASTFDDVRRVALVAKQVLDDHALVGWPKTSGSRGIHILVRLERRWTFSEVRRAALALAREVEQRAPDLATSRWWKEERHGVFVDFNQNARDRTVASAYSVRPLDDARVSTPLRWDEVAACDPAAFTIRTVPARYDALGDLHAGIDDAACSLEPLLETAERQRAQGLDDAPAPPKHPLITVAKAKARDDALAGLERWKARHPEAAEHLGVEDVLVDAMRGRSSMWTRVRVNLRHVPEAARPPEEPPDPDYDPWEGFRWR